MSKPPSMISAKSLGAMPQFATAELGRKSTESAMLAAGLPLHFLDIQEGYIPEHSLVEFIRNVSCRLGYDGLGLLWAPYLTVADYGAWGSYVLSAPDLKTALRRAEKEMKYHSNTDQVRMHIGTNLVSYSYEFGLRAHSSYADIAFSAIAAVLSIPRHFLGANWAPTRIEFDIVRPPKTIQIEETFRCPVTFGHQTLRVLFPRHLLSAPNPTRSQTMLTSREDISRERGLGPPNSLFQSACATVLIQLSDQSVSMDRTALLLGTSVRTLQRHLNEEGVSFRMLVNDVRMQRARELLGLKGTSVTTVATVLGYSSPNNFSRAFSTRFGMSPRHAQKLFVVNNLSRQS
ncbi:hypothetical protein DS909_18780 [Phaeobacter gallaeciensis]|uniref:HTH araC/xylS-type domain-containing protein n=1 Tax=Phaeobacter gallaeciensis TaxID=60890 RepID=A0A366WQL5_9RHOB|nr:AraC family transcriptional regulator [Phaeobacter gallaeciensis]RBW51633.1 hypothetical protein DS909_18780 [Phaeobacter gallaeciensis]